MDGDEAKEHTLEFLLAFDGRIYEVRRVLDERGLSDTVVREEEKR